MKHTSQVKEIRLWNIILDVFIIFVFLNTAPILQDHVEPFHRGFFCNDETIRYPYKPSTIHDLELYTVTVLINILCMVGLELWQGRAERGSVLVAGCAVPAWVARVVRHILLFGYGLGAEEFFTQLAKFSAGRLRPSFLDVCKPNVVCNATGMDPHAYITEYECTGEQGFTLLQARLSFPSGHAAVAFYGAVFAVFYLEKRVRWPKRIMVYKTAVEILIVATAWFCALTRIQDFKHHWGDVLAGSLIGAGVACFWVPRIVLVGEEKEEVCSTVTTETNTFVFPNEDNIPEQKL